MKTRSQQDFVNAVGSNEVEALKWGHEAYYGNSLVMPVKISSFVDAGANVGGFSLEVLRNHPEACGYMFEPSIALADICRRRFQGNSKISVHQVALAKEANHRTLWQNINQIGAGSIVGESNLDALVGGWEELQGVPQPVEVRTLDSYDMPSLDVLKVDVEGAEGLLLQGGFETIKRCMPLIIMEVGYGRHKHPTWPDVVIGINQVMGLGYEMIGCGASPNDDLQKLVVDHPCFDNHINVVMLPPKKT